MWRIWGYIVKGDKNYFTIPNEKSFDKVKIEQFCFDNGLALYDTAEEIVRLKNNASDNFLQVVRPTDLSGLLKKIPHCRAIVATGQKSAEILQASVGCNSLPIGGCFDTEFEGRKIAIWRMPSTSRAYPRPIEWKAEYYRNMFEQISVCKM